MLFFIDLTPRPRLDITGPDRAKFLHNLTTNDIKRLPVGHGCEAFVTSPQGKTLGYVTLLADDDRIILRTDPGGLDAALPHLRKYGIFDEVSIDEVEGFEIHLAGPDVDTILAHLGATLPEPGDLRHVATSLGNAPILLVREAPTGRPGLTILGAASDAPAVLERLKSAGASATSLADFEALRIAAGTPVFGRDVTADNLPQEVARDDRAINFVKGCYLGQETVARIDALGHVNKMLRGLIVAGPNVPPPGATIEADGKPIGVVTSSALSATREAPIALGYVRRSHIARGTAVRIVDADRTWDATVSALPM